MSDLMIDLLTYIEEVEKLKSKSVFAVPTDSFVAYQHELKGLPELQFNLQTNEDDIWLCIPRLQEIQAPPLADILVDWVTLPKSPDKTPELKSEINVYRGSRVIDRQSLSNCPEIREYFDWYVENQWQPWAVAEQPRRKTIARYNQLFSLQQAIASQGAETAIELVWGIGFATWKKEGYDTAVRHPLIVQACELALNEKTFAIEIRPRDKEARLETDCYTEMGVSGVLQLESYWKSHLAAGGHRANPFEHSTFEGILKAAVGYLDSTGAYEVQADAASPAAPTKNLKISSSWVVFARKRSADIFLEDIRRLKQNIEANPILPPVIRSFVEHGDSTVRTSPLQSFRGLSASDDGAGGFELYFPMPYNDEQVSIVQKLEAHDGVVVQGPPGTGKTHTIANVICHFLAQGKRVLVTAKGESALAVLQEKLPLAIRPLSVALLSDERDGMKQFEHAIQTIASGVASLKPTDSEAKIARCEERLNQLHAKISNVDRTVSQYASEHMRHYKFQGHEVAPEGMAKLVLEQAEEHQWFDDEPPETTDGLLPFSDAEVSALRQARIRVGDQLKYFDCVLPATDALPTWAELADLHRDLVRARAIEQDVVQGNLIKLIDTQFETYEKARALSKFIDERTILAAKLTAPWAKALCQKFADLQPDDPALAALLELCSTIQGLEACRRELLAKAINLPTDAELNEDFCSAVTRLVMGKSAFAWRFGKAEARNLMAAVTVDGIAPRGAEGWALAQRLLFWRTEARKAVARWTSYSSEFGLQPPSATLDTAFRDIALWQAIIQDTKKFVFEYDQHLHQRLIDVIGKLASDRLWHEGEPFLQAVSTSLQAHLDKGRLAYAMRLISELLQKMEGCSGEITQELQQFLTMAIGGTGGDEDALQSTWRAMLSRLTSLNRLRPSFEEISQALTLIEGAGARLWGKRLRTIAAESEGDSQIPARWLEAWNWRQACLFLDRIDGHHRLRKLFDERKALTIALTRTYEELVAEKTWLGVYNNSPSSIRQALQAYLGAVQKSTGTGGRAIRNRRNAREAMTRAYLAVPCWVMPQWRVSETIPSEVGLFDLVVVDEASQSDIWALPALLRGKKLLVVGDHKQVSPSFIGIKNQRIDDLEKRCLANQPHGRQMGPDQSIYDLARVVFAGNSVMLKEHFRCVPAIIEYSNREFYNGEITPLRLPKVSERLDPPLIDIFVKGGYRDGDVNKPEAKAIVDEIEAILADELCVGRSIGVVTLLGTLQAVHIQELISERISPINVVARKIAVGPPPVFQGRERDIMLVSMVLAPGDRAAQNRSDQQQRFNVALSRARDRMYLFRSVEESAYSEDTLNARLMRHFRHPFTQDARQVEVLRERCESGFEFEMFDELVKHGYRVQPQVRCGGYRIDFVVEGSEGRRLAIECDGDRFHGPGRWADDMRRQRVLERAGWIFWRCFASTFTRQRKAVLDDLWQTLAQLGIEPVGTETVDNSVWTHSKVVDPFGVEALASEAETV